MRIIDEETFGPSASVYIVDTVDEAIKLANRSKYGLTATIHSRSLQHALSIGQELEYAQVHINSVPLVGNPYAPAGGVKASGWGRNNAKWAFDEYLVEKHLTWRQGGQGLLYLEKKYTPDCDDMMDLGDAGPAVSPKRETICQQYSTEAYNAIAKDAAHIAIQSCINR
ncbi:hypothetical protein NM208_g12304 [Fusarium decemcellulare]|uniref:Uncharacterized protein n=1 Tax=Fusarium decemcellulare TaxID=57161 RepID=A0ACC1RP53_9HYPO|nr:hypothetical protein NM208_g12304 [Fusarium decemcellulare]